MKKIITSLSVCLLVLMNHNAQAQVGLSRADKTYDKLAYIDAIKIYENIAKRGHVSTEILKNLGNANYFNAQYAEANKWYSQLFADFASSEIESEYYYRYSQTLKNVGQDAQAAVYLKQFAEKNKESKRADIIRADKDYQAEIKRNSGRYDIQDAGINTGYADYGSSFYKDQVLFTTARDTSNFAKKVHTWTDQSFTKIYVADIQEDGTLTKAKKFSRKIDTKFNEATPVVTKDGQTMYFTRNNYNGSRGTDSKKTTLLKIYRAELKGDKWTNVTELPFNSNQFSTAHPVLNANEDTMYFVSDRPGGFGQSDLWSVAIMENGFGTPVNLGASINTDGRESFPFVTSDDELYFATDGRPGMGGLDVYATKIKADGSFSDVQNIGASVNSPSDDFGYIINKTTKRGYFSSNRESGIGNDDIYAFKENRALVLECVQGLKVTVVDAKTRNIIPNANLSLYQMDFTDKAKSNKMDANSQYLFDTNYDCGTSYRVKAEAPEYTVKEEVVSLPNESGITEITIVLERAKIPLKEGDDLFKVLNLNPIYFDLDKDNIRPDAALELAKVFAVMEEYPSMKVDVRSHTDSRASHKYNDDLSERRAKSTAAWLISNGIYSNRLTWKGYGERQLTNKCADGVKCTEEEHQANRRSEFIIVKM
ncbi:OmpA family protein [Flavobacterium sp. NKUCC04_CG]|uniref:OmpA family protein n=1 Tax=Flavobacterium sp. NKUCC04_CG TaxID=2842121 RepID=UPI001C5BB752|nr:OmpA family protein [Flavobacterium sp. NKUCC04_CG]MBW3518362.1 OmpA family protein [Flavobacterium sp. NKUCC04_CG]